MKILRLAFALSIVLTVVFALAACGRAAQPEVSVVEAQAPVSQVKVDPANLETATFAGGCFWSMQRMMDEVSGVITTTVGYAGGNVPNPTYERVSTETTGHAESVEVIFDTTQITYAELVDAYWHDIDPIAFDQQFCDRGSSYRSVIFYHNDEQKQIAESSKAALEASGRFNMPVVTQIRDIPVFYPAEDYHQKFYLKNPEHYAAYRAGCGRDARLAQIWGTTAQ